MHLLSQASAKFGRKTFIDPTYAWRGKLLVTPRWHRRGILFGWRIASANMGRTSSIALLPPQIRYVCSYSHDELGLHTVQNGT